jgi:hypothetical protein
MYSTLPWNRTDTTNQVLGCYIINERLSFLLRWIYIPFSDALQGMIVRVQHHGLCVCLSRVKAGIKEHHLHHALGLFVLLTKEQHQAAMTNEECQKTELDLSFHLVEPT